MLRQQLDRIRCLADIGKAVAALVINEGGDIMTEPRAHLVPDAKIGSQRIDEHQNRLVVAIPAQIIVNDDIVDLGKLHDFLLLRDSVALSSG
ncbi:hypothetical protein [Brucella ovis]|uniref:hypothetical protein n=2 Tax=Brucella ovis TaxID=236 RepID=UPI003CC7C4C6